MPPSRFFLAGRDRSMQPHSWLYEELLLTRCSMFNRLKCFFAVTLAFLILGESALAQSSGDGSTAQLPGVNFNGQRYGFTPGYSQGDTQVNTLGKAPGYMRPQRSPQ